MRNLEGKVALVTGAGRGIGRAVAEKLAAEGARVVVNDLDRDPAMEVVEAIRAAGGEAVACHGSVSVPDFADRFIRTAVDHYKGVDIIVNNAGSTWDNVIQKMSDEQWYTVLDTHLTAPFRILRAAQPVIRNLVKAEAGEGRDVFRKIVNISSVSGAQGNAGQANYSAAKAGILGLTKSLAKEWSHMKVNVNAVAFACIATHMTSAGDTNTSPRTGGRDIKVGVDNDPSNNAAAQIPFGSAYGSPYSSEDAAGAVYMFCIPESNHVSGQVMVCGSGSEGL